MVDHRLTAHLRDYLWAQGATDVTHARVRRRPQQGAMAVVRWVDGPTYAQLEQTLARWDVGVTRRSARRYRSWGQLLVARRHGHALHAWIRDDRPMVRDDDPQATLAAADALGVDPNRWPHGNTTPTAIAEKVDGLQPV